MQRMWKDGVDPSATGKKASIFGHLTQALNQGRLGDWPVLIKAPGEPKLAWSMPQLLGVLEPRLVLLNRRIDEQEIIARVIIHREAPLGRDSTPMATARP